MSIFKKEDLQHKPKFKILINAYDKNKFIYVPVQKLNQEDISD